jgi:energy-converting hydrogenase Eha subunit C
MNTKLLMATSAIVLGAIGIALTFMPEEVSHFLKLTESSPIIFQILGALYFGFAMLNWTAKGNLIGGIYSRPVAIGNFSHFLIGGLALIKLAINNLDWTSIWICAILYLIFASLFGWVLFTNPVSSAKK